MFLSSYTSAKYNNLLCPFWQVIAVGPGSLDEEGKVQPLPISTGSTVLYSKYAGNDFKGKDGSNYIALRASDVMAILS